jgi:hypothetical protein
MSQKPETKMSEYGIMRVYSASERLKVPIRYLLIIDSHIDMSDEDFVRTFTFEDLSPDSEIVSIFEVILSYSERRFSLYEVYKLLIRFAGIIFTKPQFPFLWIHAHSQYQRMGVQRQTPSMRINEEDAKLRETLKKDLVAFYQGSGISRPVGANLVSAVFSDYQIWRSAYQDELEGNVREQNLYREKRLELEKFKPLPFSPIIVDEVTISYSLVTDPFVNELMTYFHEVKTDHLLPYAQYNGEADENGNVLKLYKIYRGRLAEDIPNYATVVPERSKAMAENTIYYRMWMGKSDNPEDARRGGEKNFSTVILKRVGNVIRVTMKIPYRDEKSIDQAINRFHSHFLNPRPPPSASVKETRIVGSFQIYYIDLAADILLDMIANDELFSTFLFEDESARSYTERKKVSIGYYSISLSGKDKMKGAVISSLREGQLQEGEIVNTETITETKEGRQRTVEKRQVKTSSYIHVQMTKGSSRKTAENFRDTLARLLTVYGDTKRYAPIARDFKNMFPDFEQLVERQRSQELAAKGIRPGEGKVTVVSRKTKNGKIISKWTDPKTDIWTELRKHAPDIFIRGDARRCQKGSQPILINEDEIEIWENFLTETGDKRLVVRFPKENPKYILTCPTRKAAYLGLQEIPVTDGEGKGVKYRYLPCCHKGDQKKAWDNYMKGIPLQKSSAASSHQLVTDKLLKPRQFGILSPSVTAFLRQYNPDYNFSRVGVIRSPNSFIHALLQSLDPRYLTLKEEDKEPYAMKIRNEVIKQHNTEVMRQEFYDFTNEEIEAQFQLKKHNDLPEEFLDPLYTYRIFEEFYDCHIYLFSLSEKTRRAGYINDQASFLLIPRFKHFHSVIQNDRKRERTVLIVRYWGSDANNLPYPQCEPIVHKRTERDIIPYFNNRMHKLIFPAFQFICRTITWSADETNTLTMRKDIYFSFNYRRIFKQYNLRLDRQYIDAAGKTRLLQLYEVEEEKEEGKFLREGKFVRKGKSDEFFYAQIIPIQPYDLGSFDPYNVEIKLPSSQQVLAKFGPPSSASYVDNVFVGLWYTLGDLPNGMLLFCSLSEKDRDAIRRLPLNEEVPIYTFHPEFYQYLSRPEAVRRLKRAADLLEQIVIYLYTIYLTLRRSGEAAKRGEERKEEKEERKERSGAEREKRGRREEKEYKRSVDDFLDRYTIFDESNKDSLSLYRMSSVPQILPLPGSSNDPLTVLNALSKAPFVRQGKIIINHSRISESLQYTLNKVNRALEGTEVDPRPYRQLDRYYEKPSDYSLDLRYEFIITRPRDFVVWCSRYVVPEDSRRRLNLNIQTRLTVAMSSFLEPFIYQLISPSITQISLDPQQNVFYLVQNVVGGSMGRAITVAYEWRKNHRNLGSQAPEFTGPDVGQGQVEVPYYIIYNILGTGTIFPTEVEVGDFISLLRYSDNVYAALLPLSRRAIAEE